MSASTKHSRRPTGTLDSLLKQSGLSFSEWLDLQAKEEVAPYQYQLMPEPDLLNGAPASWIDPRAITGSLRKTDWAFEDVATDYLSHDIHPYPAKFIPQIPRRLIQLLSERGELIWDPFGGSGTTALEATLFGRRCVSTDVNPLATLIGRAKATTLTLEDEKHLDAFCTEIATLATNQGSLGELIEHTRRRWTDYVPDIPNLESWFHRFAVEELAYLRWRIQEQPSEGVRTLCLAAFSRSILRASFQDSETRYVAKQREVGRGEVARIFASLLRAVSKKARTLGPLLHFRKPEFYTLDLRDASQVHKVVPPGSVDLIVCSPPYPNATDYHLYHRFRLFWTGFDPRQLANSEIGSHLRHQKQRTGFEEYVAEMTQCVQVMYDGLRPSRYCVLVLGDAVFRGKTYKTASEIALIAKKIGFEHVTTVDRAVHGTRRSFIAAARRLRTEQLLVLRKPDRTLVLQLTLPRYKLWQYEDILRARELEAVTGKTPNRAGSGEELTATLPSTRAGSLKRLVFSREFLADEYAPERTWQSVLENGDSNGTGSKRNGARKDPKYVTHGIHGYKGKFYPQLARALMNLADCAPGSRVLDPFCGSGTVILEACLNGYAGTGLDVSPLATKIALAKVSSLSVDPMRRDRLLGGFAERLSEMSADEMNLDRFPEANRSEILSWFPKPVASKLGWTLSEIEKVADRSIQELLHVLVSSIVREISQQEPKDLRIRRRKVPLSDAHVQELLKARVAEARARLRRFAEIENWAPSRFLPQAIYTADARRWDAYAAAGLTESSIDAVVTSPPYATALPYVDTDRLSFLLLLGMSGPRRQEVEGSLIGNREIRLKIRKSVDELIKGGDFAAIPSKTGVRLIKEVYEHNSKTEVGFRRQNTAALLYGYFRDMAAALRNIGRALKSGGSAFVVIGDNRTTAGRKEIRIRSGIVLSELGEAACLELKERIPITVTQESRLHNKNSITENDILWFTKA